MVVVARRVDQCRRARIRQSTSHRGIARRDDDDDARRPRDRGADVTRPPARVARRASRETMRASAKRCAETLCLARDVARASYASTSGARGRHYDGRVPVDDAYPRRVVVTGLGLVTPLGAEATMNWRRALAGERGTRALEAEDVPASEREAFERRARANGGATWGAGIAHDAYDGSLWCEGGRLAPFVGFGRCAAAEAVTDAGLTFGDEARDDVGVSFGAGMGGVSDLTHAGGLMRDGELRKLSPYFVPKILANAAAGKISMDFKLRGPNLAAATACATSAHCIGDAFRALQRGDASVMIAGGSEGCIDLVSMSAFAKARALSASGRARPFDSRRDGFVMGEGAGVLILETLEHARERGAKKVYAEIRGYGASGDAHHVTRASPDGDGAARAMRAALRDAGIDDPFDVGYVNAHATGTPLGDAAEVRALKTVFGAEAIESGAVATTSTKGATGHLLGAAGAIEAAYTALTLHTGDVPPTCGYEELDSTLGIPIVGVGARLRESARAAMSNSFGFGGTNASLIFARAPPLE